jgi:hypothetical protein
VEETVSTALDPRVIEQEIARIREKESSPYSAGTKTNLFTLLIFRGLPAGAPGDPVDASLQFLLGRRPARIITIQRDKGGPTEAWVSGRCFPDRRNRGVCFEEVRINAGDDGVGADPGAWAPLVIRDLPVFAWLPDGRGPDNDAWRPTLATAADLIDKLIVDTSLEPKDSGPASALPWLREMATVGHLLADFAWRRGKVLREQTARAFDPPEMRALVPQARSVRLYGGSASEAELYFRWLDVRLERPVAAEHAWVGPLNEGFRVTIGIDGEKDVEIGCTRGGCLSRGEEKSAYRYPSDGEILMEEVDSTTRDPVFSQVIASGGNSNG